MGFDINVRKTNESRGNLYVLSEDVTAKLWRIALLAFITLSVFVCMCGCVCACSVLCSCKYVLHIIIIMKHLLPIIIINITVLKY